MNEINNLTFLFIVTNKFSNTKWKEDPPQLDFTYAINKEILFKMFKVVRFVRKNVQ